MTIDEAIFHLRSIYYSDFDISDEQSEAINLADRALHLQKNREKNDPLSIEALKVMPGKPVYVVNLLENSLSSWGIVCRSISQNYILTVTCNDEWAGLQNKYYFQTYKTEWIAYIHKPDE